jgi:hypothetical protein
LHTRAAALIILAPGPTGTGRATPTQPEGELMTDLEAIEAIKQLKYRYLRHLDCKEWTELKELFVDDATSAYGDGKYSYQGRDAIVSFLTDALDRRSMLTTHQVHHPEIEITSDTTATGVWSLEDIVIDLQHEITIRGAAFYRDEYVKVNGRWKFKSTGYTRIYEEIAPRPADGPAKLTANRFAEE